MNYGNIIIIIYYIPWSSLNFTMACFPSTTQDTGASLATLVRYKDSALFTPENCVGRPSTTNTQGPGVGKSTSLARVYLTGQPHSVL